MKLIQLPGALSTQGNNSSNTSNIDTITTSTNIPNTTTTIATTMYASALINPPPHANPKLAAREGIKAQQFAISGIKDSAISHLNNQQIKELLNNTLLDLGMSNGKIRLVTSIPEKGIILEADSDPAARWLTQVNNQQKICKKIDPTIKFQARNYMVIALNVPADMDPKNHSHIVEICEANNFPAEPPAIITANWAKALENHNTNQCTAHLYLTFNNTETANRAIISSLLICNKKCSVEKRRREPTRCLKCQGWNHIARDCTKTVDTCGNCAGQHRTNACKATDKKYVSCKTDDHTSWSCQCPTFLKKLMKLNNRSLDNSTIYFPTSEPWTWTPKVEALHPPTNKFSPELTHFRHSNTNATSRPNIRSMPSFYPANKTMNRRQPLANRQIDTYFPRQSHWQPQQDYHDTEQRN